MKIKFTKYKRRPDDKLYVTARTGSCCTGCTSTMSSSGKGSPWKRWSRRSTAGTRRASANGMCREAA